jgi:hypothetical protein
MAERKEAVPSPFGDLPIPEVYPEEAQTRLHTAAHDYFLRAAVDPRLQSEFRSAWNAVVHRFMAAEESARSFAESVRHCGPAPPNPERYRQERDFFHFVVNSVACMESLHYGVYAWGACRKLQGFSLSDEGSRKAVNEKSVLSALTVLRDARAIADALKAIQALETYKELRNMRIVLFHRGLPGRHIQLSVGGPPKQPSRYADFGDLVGPDITPDASLSRCCWLASCLKQAVPLAADWVERTSRG